LSDNQFRWNVGPVWSNPVSFKITGATADAQAGTPFLSTEAARRLLNGNPETVAKQARNLLKINPADPNASCVLGTALRRQGRYTDATAVLKPLTDSQPQMRAAWYELGSAWMLLDHRDNAIHALLKAIDLDYLDRDTWYALGDLLDFPRSVSSDSHDVDIQTKEAEAALLRQQYETAERILRDLLQAHPTDAGALKLLADVSIKAGRWNESEPLLRRCLELEPGFTAARFRLVTMCIAHKDLRHLLPHIDALIESDPANTLYLSLKALTLWWSRQFDSAIAQFETFIGSCSDRPGLWLEYARLLHAARSDKAIEAYTKVVTMLPSFADAYISFANIKSFRVEDNLVEQIYDQLARTDLAPEDRARFHYVLGKALEDLKQYSDSFENYRKCNEILRSVRGSAIENSNLNLRHSKAFFTPAFFHARAGYGCTQTGPIFIVGMPRSGSTLVEQILSSHSEVEALGERNDLTEAGRRLAPDRPGDPRGGYPYVLQELDAQRFRLIGEEYLRTTGARRHYDTTFFTDKMPGNHLHIGLIHLALPNSRIIDVRRHPLDCCFSCFKHYFQSAHSYSLGLADVGRFYANYVELMAHFDEVLPGRVHRIFYEALVENFETEVRRLLDFVGLPFEEDCLRFHENQRLVLTLSADQVNRPLYSGAGQWRNYERWLDPLKQELGPVLELYPGVPRFASGMTAAEQTIQPVGGTDGQATGFVAGLRQQAFGGFVSENHSTE